MVVEKHILCPECAFALYGKAPKQCAISGFYVPRHLSVNHRVSGSDVRERRIGSGAL